MLSNSEKDFLYDLASSVDEGAILEIGCHSGGSTYFLARGAHRHQKTVYSIDPFLLERERQVLEDDGSGYFHQSQICRKPSKAAVAQTLAAYGIDNAVLIEGFSEEIAPTWKIPLGMLWIDGNHAHAAEDFYAFQRHLLPGAIVAFHDTQYGIYPHGRKDVTTAVNEILGNGYIQPGSVAIVDSITAFRANINSRHCIN
ncbi:class I SAM-dependent methyltransferase [Candidatus Woesearchaeota archaeon]|nr:class I SAM-dependent methyltransferase [Candidatus Woesearchaeota archaeon]